MRRLQLSRRTPLVLGALILILVLAALPQARTFFAYRYEELAWMLSPSAARAFSYGERHFDARQGAGYDIDRAYAFFERAALLDPKYPYLYHELARISFLRGNFTLALQQINFQILMHGDSEPNSYYVRGLIEGYMGRYQDAARDYAYFIQFDWNNWAALNDYAWILLKAGKAGDARGIAQSALALFPGNPWLLNSYAIALFETGSTAEALEAAQSAAEASKNVSEADWLRAYPGNDPKAAPEGIAALQRASADNMHMIETSLASSTLQ